MILRDLEQFPNRKREFNYLSVINLDKFFNDYPNNIDYYQPPFAILAELESRIKYSNILPLKVFVPYKDGGEITFDFVDAYEQGHLRVVEYQYTNSVS